jgi:hypothetical protein
LGQGISRQALASRLKNPTLSTIEEISVILNVSPVELINPGPDYSHFYDATTGEWLGVRKK